MSISTLMTWRPSRGLGIGLAGVVAGMAWLVFGVMPSDPLGFWGASCETKEYRYEAVVSVEVDGMKTAGRIRQVERDNGTEIAPLQRYYNLDLPDGRVFLLKAESVNPAGAFAEGALIRPAAAAGSAAPGAFIVKFEPGKHAVLDVLRPGQFAFSKMIEGGAWKCRDQFIPGSRQHLDVSWNGSNVGPQFVQPILVDVFLRPEGYAATRMQFKTGAADVLYGLKIAIEE